jgi:hypothetical protein
MVTYNQIEDLAYELQIEAKSHFYSEKSAYAKVALLDAAQQLITERDEALADGVLSQKVCDLENENAQLKADLLAHKNALELTISLAEEKLDRVKADLYARLQELLARARRLESGKS